MKPLTCTSCGSTIDKEHDSFRGFLANKIARLGSELVTLRTQEEALLKRKFSKAFRKKWEEEEVLRKIITDKISALESDIEELQSVNKKLFNADQDLY